MPAPEKTDRNNAIMRDLSRMTSADAARKYGISRQRVEQIAQANGGFPPNRIMYRDYSSLDRHIGYMADSDVARVTGKTYGQVHYRRVMRGLPPFHEIRPFKCNKCDTEPYAKGLCRNCYARLRRAESLDKTKRAVVT